MTDIASKIQQLRADGKIVVKESRQYDETARRPLKGARADILRAAYDLVDQNCPEHGNIHGDLQFLALVDQALDRLPSVFDAVRAAGHDGSAPAPDESDSRGELPAATVAELVAIRQHLCGIARIIEQGYDADLRLCDQLWSIVEDLTAITGKVIDVPGEEGD